MKETREGGKKRRFWREAWKLVVSVFNRKGERGFVWPFGLRTKKREGNGRANLALMADDAVYFGVRFLFVRIGAGRYVGRQAR